MVLRGLASRARSAGDCNCPLNGNGERHETDRLRRERRGREAGGACVEVASKGAGHVEAKPTGGAGVISGAMRTRLQLGQKASSVAGKSPRRAEGPAAWEISGGTTKEESVG